MKTTVAALALIGFAAAGCGGSGNSVSGQGVRTLNALATAPELSVLSGTNIIADPLPYATESGSTRTPYTTLPVGANPITATNGSVQVANSTVNLLSLQSVNVIVTPAASGDLLILNDDTSQLTDSEVRFVNASSLLSSADIILTPAGGSPLPTITVTSGNVNPVQPASPGFLYQDLTPGTYRLQVFPTGQESSPAIIDEQTQLIAVRRWTFVVVDPPAGQSTPGLVQVQDSQLLNPN